MKLSDIKPFIDYSSCYSVTVGWKHLENWLETAEADVELEPDFQRAHVWSEDKQRAYIEFCLRGGASARTLLWNCPNWGRISISSGPMQLVDGLQRLTAVRKFLRNELKVFGHLLNEFEDDLTSMDQRFTIIVNELETRAEVLQWYLEINDGGVVHSKEELDRVRKLLEQELQ